MDTLTHTGTGTTRTFAGGLVRRTALDTPRRLVLAAALVALLAAGFTVILAQGTSAARGALSSMAAKTGEVSATNDLYFRLNDMDAQAANTLLVGFHPTIEVPASSSASASMATYEKDRAAASADLQQIAANPNLAGRYTRLLTAIGGYEGLVAQAVYIDQGAQNEAPATPPAAALALYRQASDQMHTSVLPIAADVTAQDSANVDGMYSADRGGAQLDAVLVAMVGLLLAGALVAAHWYLGRRFRRILTPTLALAAALTVVVTGLGFSVLLHEAQQLWVAKSEAFDSINALTNARAVAYDANADESRWLLDPTGVLQSSYFAKVEQVAGTQSVNATDAANDPTQYYTALQQSVGALKLNQGANSVTNVQLRGLLGTELNNITFPGEAQGAYTTTKAFSAYVQDDATIRADAERSDLADAVRFDVGTTAGESNATFYQYDQALLGIIGINQNAFHGAIGDGRSALGVWTWLPYATGIAVLALVGAALYPRLREYR